MFLRILSLAGPLWVYATIAVLIYGIVLERNRFDWFALALGAVALLTTALFLSSTHRLFFDEDIYINVASNLTRAPVNQLTVMGGPNEIQVSTYNKEPVGWPVLLSFAFLIAGRSETVAFWFARLLFALAVAALYQLTRELLQTRRQALLAAILFGATPVCVWYSVSTGTDMPSALMGILGMWGLVTGNGPLAAAGFAFAAQTRLELLVLIPLVWLSPKISPRWKIGAAALALFEIVHVAWLMSVAPVLARAAELSAAFGLRYVRRNLFDNLKYFFDPFGFPILVSVFVAVFLWKKVRRPVAEGDALIVWIFGLFAVYLCFFAGSFDMNPRYSIQMVAPMTILAASLANRPVWIGALLLSAIVPATHRYETTPYFKALETEHRLSTQFASQINPDDLIVSGAQEVFINHGRSAISAPFASTGKIRLEDEIRKHGKVWYHAGVRANIPNSEEWRADRWVKSNFGLRLIDSHEVGGYSIAFYEILLKRVDREARQASTFPGQRGGCDRGLV
ncbi:MAG: hypothetical protein DMG15_17950 [Acidobacteria bacterium]|nr:MAG: hypothetical protein DMG15_17950 [Acidobacteriota bacterium]